MNKSEFAQYLRQRNLKKSFELSKFIGVPKDKYEAMVKALSDDEIISSYRTCSCGAEWLSKKEMESLIQKYDDPERIFNEVPSGHE